MRIKIGKGWEGKERRRERRSEESKGKGWEGKGGRGREGIVVYMKSSRESPQTITITLTIRRRVSSWNELLAAHLLDLT